MSAPFVPDGVPHLLTTGEVARLICRQERHVRYKLESGAWEYIWEGGRRYMRAADLARWAELVGIPLAWQDVIC